MAARKRKQYGKHIVSDPEVCGGDLTFTGTRILVGDALALTAKGYDWDRISREFDGRVSREAIAEALKLAWEAVIERNRRHRRPFRADETEEDVDRWVAQHPRRELGRFIVSDPEICGGDLTFKGTRMLVEDVLDYVAEGADWDWISAAYFGRVSREAIAEAVELASEELLAKGERWRQAA